MRTKVSAGDEIADRHLGGRRSDRNPYAASRHSRRAFSDVTESALHQLEHTSGRGLRDHDLSIGDDVASRRSTAHGIEFGCAITDDGDRIHVGKVGDRRDLDRRGIASQGRRGYGIARRSCLRHKEIERCEPRDSRCWWSGLWNAPSNDTKVSTIQSAQPLDATKTSAPGSVAAIGISGRVGNDRERPRLLIGAPG